MAQNDTGVRVGRVSSINYQAGTARVVFGDKDSAVTKEVPFVSNNEYNMPLVGDLVQVSHNSNGTMAATIPGSTWNQNNKPMRADGESSARNTRTRKTSASRDSTTTPASSCAGCLGCCFTRAARPTWKPPARRV